MLNQTKRLLKKAIILVRMVLGYIFVKFFPLDKYKRYLLSTWQLQEKRSRFDNFLYEIYCTAWFKFVYLAEKDPDKREELKSIAMGGAGGRRWAESYNNRPIDLEEIIGNMSYKEACPVLPKLDNILSGLADVAIVVQIGSSSGREITWLAERYPKNKYIGIEPYEEVVDFTKKNHILSNLTFEKWSAKDISSFLFQHGQGRYIIFSSGSLQYVQPEHVIIFFNSISKYKSLELMLSEPVSELKGNPEEIKGSTWRGNFSYTHNYKLYAESAGLITIESRIIRQDENKTARDYFYYGKTNPSLPI